MPFAWAAGIAAVGAIGGAVISSNAAGDAAETQAAAAREGQIKAEEARREFYGKAEGALSPFAQLGESALPTLKSLLGLDGSDPTKMMETLEKFPGYQFAVGQGQKALDTAAIGAGGGTLAPNALKALADYSRNSASSLFSDYYGKLMGVTNTGLNAAGGIANAATGVGNQIGSERYGAATDAGNAMAAGQAATGRIWGQAVTDIGQLAGSAYGKMYANPADQYDFSGATGQQQAPPRNVINR